MKELIDMGIEDAIKMMDAFGDDAILDGTVIHASMAEVEMSVPSLADRFSKFGNWKKEWTDSRYHYRLLIARKGVVDVLDQNGDVCGFEVVGTGRGK